MKRCPECRRDYYDDSLLYCLDDGNALLDGPALARSSDDEPATAILSEPGAIATGFRGGEEQTRAFVNTTDQTAILRTGAEAEPRGSLGDLSERQSHSAQRAAEPKSFNKRLLLAPLALAVIVLGGFLGYRYFNASGSAAINSIAVMPFENRNSDADTDYLSDGLAESVIFRLTQIPDLRVSPTSSVMRYKGKETDVAKIASELGVDAVMTGRLTKRGDNLNITVELVDARTNKSLWGEQYERNMSDLLATQREIATTITQKLQLKLKGDETGITKKYTDSNEAYQLYLRGRYAFGKRTKDEMLKAVEYFEQAIKLDPKFALAHARIAETYGSMPAYPYMAPKEAFPPAKAAAQKALEIDPTLSEAHTFLAYCLIIYDWNWTEGERSFKRAIELDPNNSAAHFRYGQIYLMPTRRFEEGIAEIKRGLELEPLDMNMGGSLASAYFFAGRKDEALEQARKVHDVEPTHPIARWILSQAFLEKGMYEESRAHNERWLQDDPTNQFALRDAGIAYAKLGKREKAEEMIARLREVGKKEYIPTNRIAVIYGALGELDKAFVELEKAFDARDWELYRSDIEPYMNDLRSDPRFAVLVKRLNRPN
ncbi:MAG: tetratricopeptide repeat protein [Blastocatellia bacterium]